jgi:hypothetical protein
MGCFRFGGDWSAATAPLTYSVARHGQRRASMAESEDKRHHGVSGENGSIGGGSIAA